jgi:5-methylcytosine-specific restriction endonuclease McrA
MPEKRIFTQEMIDDLYKIGDQEYKIKWNISHVTIMKFRKENGIKPFVNQCGTISHKIIDGIEHKHCSKGHWEPIENFFHCKTNYDGVQRECKTHSMEKHYEWLSNKRGPEWKPTTTAIEHKFENGIELKLCPRGNHWESLDKFSKCPSRLDGLRAICKEHEKVSASIYHATDGSKRAIKAWKQTPSGRESQRRLWRRKAAERKQLLYDWLPEDEHFSYDIFEHKCAYCGVELDFLELEFDHFIPRALKGPYIPENIVPCCVKCNHGVGGKFDREAFEWLTSKFGEDRAILIYKDVKKKLRLTRKV